MNYLSLVLTALESRFNAANHHQHHGFDELPSGAPPTVDDPGKYAFAPQQHQSYQQPNFHQQQYSSQHSHAVMEAREVDGRRGVPPPSSQQASSSLRGGHFVVDHANYLNDDAVDTRSEVFHQDYHRAGSGVTTSSSSRFAGGSHVKHVDVPDEFLTRKMVRKDLNLRNTDA